MKKITTTLYILFCGLFLLNEKPLSAQIDTTFNYDSTIRAFRVPAHVTQITITAIGATGGKYIGYNEVGGKGAKMIGTFTIPSGTLLKILVGGAGKDGSGGGGGGGGSFVTDSANHPLIIAGGGGGTADTGAVDTGSSKPIGIDAVTDTNGVDGFSYYGNDTTDGYFSTGHGGKEGNGGTDTVNSNAISNYYGPCGGNGGGLRTNGVPFNCCSLATFGHAFDSGGAGGLDSIAHAGCFGNGQGGFGGGGSGANSGGGGGGGYSGGGGSYDEPTNGGGGGSYNKGTSQINTTAFNSAGNGQIIISMAITGIKNINHLSLVKIYPDPTNGNFDISGLEAGQTVKLYNYMGQQLSSTLISNSNVMHFNISDKANGAYLVRILNNDGSQSVDKKIMKVR